MPKVLLLVPTLFSTSCMECTFFWSSPIVVELRSFWWFPTHLDLLALVQYFHHFYNFETGVTVTSMSESSVIHVDRGHRLVTFHFGGSSFPCK